MWNIQFFLCCDLNEFFPYLWFWNLSSMFPWFLSHYTNTSRVNLDNIFRWMNVFLSVTQNFINIWILHVFSENFHIMYYLQSINCSILQFFFCKQLCNWLIHSYFSCICSNYQPRTFIKSLTHVGETLVSVFDLAWFRQCFKWLKTQIIKKRWISNKFGVEQTLNEPNSPFSICIVTL